MVGLERIAVCCTQLNLTPSSLSLASVVFIRRAPRRVPHVRGRLPESAGRRKRPRRVPDAQRAPRVGVAFTLFARLTVLAVLAMFAVLRARQLQACRCPDTCAPCLAGIADRVAAVCGRSLFQCYSSLDEEATRVASEKLFTMNQAELIELCKVSPDPG